MRRFSRLFIILLAIACATPAPAQVYIAYANVGLISEYDQDTGALISEEFVLGLKKPRSLCYANGALYVVQVDAGVIGTYDPHSGAAIRPDLVSNLNLPQAMVVADTAIYVADFDWETRQPRVGKYNAITGAAINSSFVKITGAMMNGMQMTAQAPSALAVSGNRLFVASDNPNNGVSIYDATTGALIRPRFSRMPFSSDALLADDKWLWILWGTVSPTGVILKLDADTGEGAPGTALPYPLGQQGLVRPFITNVEYPRSLALSGDDLFIGHGPGTAVGKYNATTGALINANFIASKGDLMGGLAVAPRAATEQETSADSQFEFKKSLTDFAFYWMQNWQYLFLASCLIVVALVGGVLAALFRRTTPLPAAEEESPAPEEVAPVISAEEIPSVAEEPPATTEPPPVQPISRLALAATALLLITLVTGGIVAYDIFTTPNPYGPRADEHDLVGAWEYSNDGLREASEMPVMKTLFVYATHAEYSEGAGPYDKPGTWHDNGFWIANPDGSGETEVARLTDPLDIEVHVGAFIPGRTDVPSLYKVEGTAAEKQAMAAKYPAPLTYPPPRGIITMDMTEYDLKALPWRVDYIEAVGEHAYSRGTLYHYHSDNPKIPPLEVTIKNRHVVEIHGGNE